MAGLGWEAWVIIVMVVILAIFLEIRAAANVSESAMLFRPIREYLAAPTIPHEEVTLKSGLTGWYFNNFPEAPTILYCHGNAGNISYWDNMIGVIHSQKVNVFIFDYHGFGRTPGTPSVRQCIEDGLEAYDFLAKRVHPETIVLWGESLGGSIALHIENQRKVGYVALAGTFSHPLEVVREKQLSKIIEFLAKQKDDLDNVRMIRDVKVPVVIVHSEDDDIIPYACAVELYRNVSHSCKKLVPIKGTHSAPQMNSTQLAQIFNFCELPCESCEDASPHLSRICHDKRQIFNLNQLSV